MNTMKYALQKWSTGRGDYVHAIVVKWGELAEFFGDTDFVGNPEQNSAIVEALLSSGVPAWVATGEGATDEDGWAILGPAWEG